MQVECIKPFGNAEVGELVEVPDGAAVDPAYWRLPEADSPAPAAPAAEAPASSSPEADSPVPAHFPAPGRFAPHSHAKEGAS